MSRNSGGVVMTIFAVVSNVVLFVFTLLVLATDGAPTVPVYVTLTVLLLVVPLLNVLVVIDRSRTRKDVTSADAPRLRSKSSLRRVLAVVNLALIAFVCWAIVDQYPHPEEEGLVAFIAVTLLVPLLSSVVLLRNETRSEAVA